MTGIQEVAAILGMAEVGLRSISCLYNLVKGLQNVPVEIETIRVEILTLDRTLSMLASLTRTNDDLLQCADRVGLPDAVNRCGRACDRLRMELDSCAHYGKHSMFTRLQFRVHRKSIECVLADINIAKQTTTLTVVVTQLSLQLKSSVPWSEKRVSIADARHQIAEMASQSVSGQDDNKNRRGRETYCGSDKRLPKEESSDEGAEKVTEHLTDRDGDLSMEGTEHPDTEADCDTNNRSGGPVLDRAYTEARRELAAAEKKFEMGNASVEEGDENRFGSDGSIGEFTSFRMGDAKVGRGDRNEFGIFGSKRDK